MYDTVILKCPKCKKEIDAQTKSGDCLLRYFDFPGEGDNPAPNDVMYDVNRHAPHICEDCDYSFAVDIVDDKYVLIEISEVTEVTIDEI